MVSLLVTARASQNVLACPDGRHTDRKPDTER
jgi:hypothetical protein